MFTGPYVLSVDDYSKGYQEIEGVELQHGTHDSALDPLDHEQLKQG